MVELRSSLLLLGIAQASLALLSLNRRLNNLEGAEGYPAPSVSLIAGVVPSIAGLRMDFQHRALCRHLE